MAHDPTSPYRPIYESLAQQKSNSLAQSYNTKIDKIEPLPFTISELVNEQVSQTNEIDLIQASILRGAGNISDFAKDASNVMFDTDFDASRNSGWSNPETADTLAGVSTEYRQQFQQDQRKVGDSVANEDYLGAIGDAANVALRTAADSGVTLLEVGAGSLATAFTGGLAAPFVAKKVSSIFNTAKDVKNAYDKSKKKVDDLKEANRLGKTIQKIKDLPKLTAKAAGQASLLVADLSQQQIADYREKYKEDPSLSRRGTIILTAMATSIWEPALISKLFIPNFKKQFIKEGQDIVKTAVMQKSSLINIAKRVGSAVNKLVLAGAGEAAQEYLQTWQEILAVEISPEEANDLMKAISSKIGDKKFQDMAITGSILGGAAGSATRGVISAPSVALGTAADLTVASAKGTAKAVIGTTKFVNRKLQNAANKTGFKVLSAEERETIRNDYEIEKVVVAEKHSDIDVQIKSVSEAKTFKDLSSNKAMSEIIEKTQKQMGMLDGDLKDPKNFAKFKSKILSNQRAAKDVLSASLEASNALAVVKASGKNIYDGTISKAKQIYTDVLDAIPEELVIKTIAAAITVKATAKSAIEAVKNLESSSARGLIEIGAKGSTEQFNKGLEFAKDLSMSDLKTVSTVVMELNPKRGKQLLKLYASRKKALKNFRLRDKKTLINEETIPGAITFAIKEGNLNGQSAAGFARAIKDTIAGTIANKETLSLVRQAIQIYKESDAYTDKSTKGRINELNMGIIETKLASIESSLNRELTTENVKGVKDTVTKFVKEKYNAVTKKIIDTVDNNEESIDEATTSIKEVSSVLVNTAKGLLKDTAEVAGDALESVVDTIGDTVDKYVSNKQPLDTDKPLGSGFSMINGALKEDNVKVKDLIEAIPTIVKKLIKKGYETRGDLAKIIEQFPELSKNKEFYGALVAEFDVKTKEVKDTNAKEAKVEKENDSENKNSDIVEQISDNIPSVKEDPNLAFKFFESIGLTGCKK